jgi:RNA polymerase sigma factor (sigma-70 family)
VSMEGRSDAELIELVRSGDDETGSAAWSELFDRHHGAALGYARNLAGESIAADLVSECLEKTLILLRRGQGPEGALRPYLFTAIRHAHVNHLRRSRREVPRDDIAELATTRGEAQSDGADARFEATTIMRAFASLPERWRTVLWHTAVANQPLDRVAEDLGMNANSVAALSFRAREGLRRAYLAEHLTRTPDPECRAVLDALVPYLRGGLRPRQADRAALHLDSCSSCAAAVADLADINANLGALLAPVVLAGGGLSDNFFSAAGESAGHSGAAGDHSAAMWAGIGVAVVLALGVASWVVLVGGEPRPGEPSPVSSAAFPTPVVTSPLTPDESSAGPAPGSPTVRSGNPDYSVPTASATIPRTQTPTPGVTATTVISRPPISTPTPIDVGLGAPSDHQLSTTEPRWFHIEFPVSGASVDLVMRVQLDHAVAYDVHEDHEFGYWACIQTKPSDGSFAAVTALKCRLEAEEGRSQDFGIDLSTSDDVVEVAVMVELADGRDPRAENNTARISIDPASTP